LEKYVESLIALGGDESLAYASLLAQDHPAWMVKIVELRTKHETAGHQKIAQSREFK
jgi:hypothetical protein